MYQARNIARREVLDAVADELAHDAPAMFDAGRFRRDWNDPAVRDAFREDLKEVRYREIGRFPTRTLRRPPAPGVVIVGYRPCAALRDALLQVAPKIEPARTRTDPGAYEAFWGSLTDRERASVCRKSEAPARRG